MRISREAFLLGTGGFMLTAAAGCSSDNFSSLTPVSTSRQLRSTLGIAAVTNELPSIELQKKAISENIRRFNQRYPMMAMQEPPGGGITPPGQAMNSDGFVDSPPGQMDGGELAIIGGTSTSFNYKVIGTVTATYSAFSTSTYYASYGTPTAPIYGPRYYIKRAMTCAGVLTASVRSELQSLAGSIGAYVRTLPPIAAAAVRQAAGNFLGGSLAADEFLAVLFAVMTPADLIAALIAVGLTAAAAGFIITCIMT